MDVPHEIPRASRLVSELALLQLLNCFAFSLARADPFVVATIVGLYAIRENDRRALDVYLLLVGVGAALDVLYLLILEPPPLVLLGVAAALPHAVHQAAPRRLLRLPSPGHAQPISPLHAGMLFGLVLKLAVVSPCYQLWESMPPTRLASLTPDGLTAHVRAAVASVLTKHAQARSAGGFDVAALSPPRHAVRPAPVRLPTPHTPAAGSRVGSLGPSSPTGSARGDGFGMPAPAGRGGGGQGSGSWEAV